MNMDYYKSDIEKTLKEERERHRREKKRLEDIISSLIAIIVSIITTLIVVKNSNGQEIRHTGTPVQILSADEVLADAGQEDYENENIETALLESGYFRDDVPLDCDTQAFLRSACEESGVEYELALAVIRKETEYRNLIGDGGNSYGYMQVQPVWHEERMERLGVTDLMDPYSNFRVGCDYLAELLDKYPMEEALTAYNSGSPGKSAYADTVLAYREELL